MLSSIQYLLHLIFPFITWRIKTKEKILYLSFDDGPIPEVTPWVLEELNKFHAKATFFCIGDNVIKHPDIYNFLIANGHSIGNHTFTHLNGWKTSNTKYLEDVNQAKQVIASNLFRPPYGKIKLSMIKPLRKEFKIVMWDVLSYDFDRSLDGKGCFENVRRNAREGSIIVFHDSLKANDRLRIALPEVLKYYTDKGFTFEKLS